MEADVDRENGKDEQGRAGASWVSVWCTMTGVLLMLQFHCCAQRKVAVDGR